MASVVEICNMALGHNGVNKKISALTEQSAEAVACNTFYTQARDNLLVMNDWEWAKGLIALQLAAGFELPDGNYVYAYTYPPAVLKIRRLSIIGLRNPDERQKSPYELYDDADTERSIILTDVQDAIIEVTRAKTNPQLFPTLFTTALSWHLANLICNPLRVDSGTAQKTANGFSFWLSEAIMADAGQRQKDEKQPSEFERARM